MGDEAGAEVAPGANKTRKTRPAGRSGLAGSATYEETPSPKRRLSNSKERQYPRVAAIDIDGQVGFATDEDSDSDGWMEGLEDVFGINNSKEKLDEGRHRQDKNGGQYRNDFEDSDHDTTDENKDEENCESESESGGEDNSSLG